MKKILLFLTIIFGDTFIASAQSGEAMSFYQKYQVEVVIGFAFLVCLVAFMALLVALYALRTMLGVSIFESASTREEERIGFWRRLMNKMNDAVPVRKEHEIITDHEYDGIRELDNKLPPWWVAMFWATIIFGVVYIFHYHVLGTGELQEAEYESKMAEAEAAVEAYLASLDEVIDETTVTASTDAADIANGKDLFAINCSPCHAKDGGGVQNLGPNLTDQYWIHGGTVSEIFSTIKYGVPTKGMIAWEGQLSPKQMQQLSSYIVTLEGTEPANPKEPEGELFIRGEEDTNQDVRQEITDEATDEEAADPEVPASLDGRELEIEEENE